MARSTPAQKPRGAANKIEIGRFSGEGIGWLAKILFRRLGLLRAPLAEAITARRRLPWRRGETCSRRCVPQGRAREVFNEAPDSCGAYVCVGRIGVRLHPWAHGGVARRRGPDRSAARTRLPRSHGRQRPTP